jgi:hypothetical protein
MNDLSIGRSKTKKVFPYMAFKIGALVQALHLLERLQKNMRFTVERDDIKS